MHNAFHPTASESFRPQQLQAARKFIRNLLRTTDVVADLRQ